MVTYGVEVGHRNTVARRELCVRTVSELKHKGGYKRMLHRVLQMQSRKRYSPAQAGFGNI